MAVNDGMTRIEPSSALYQEFARLYQIAQEMRPGNVDRWNGELYARTDDKWGGLTLDGTMRLNRELVLEHLTGGELSHDPARQAEALATVLHESKHARTPIDAKDEPNAVRRPESFGLDEAITELSTAEDFDEFVQRAGYDGLPQPEPEYAGAVHAGRELLDRATSSAEERKQLLTSALDQPVAMRWDAVADHIVRNELADVVPQDPTHQRAARAHLVNQMSIGEWDGVQDRPGAGRMTAELTRAGVDRAVGQIQEHYQERPGEPYPAKVPNPAAAISTETRNGEQQRSMTTASPQQQQGPGRNEPVDLSQFPPPDAGTRVDGAQPSNGRQVAGAGRGQGNSMRFLGDQAPAALATQQKPELGNGARGAAAPAAVGISRQGTDRGTAPNRGRE